MVVDGARSSSRPQLTSPAGELDLCCGKFGSSTKSPSLYLCSLDLSLYLCSWWLQRICARFVFDLSLDRVAASLAPLSSLFFAESSIQQTMVRLVARRLIVERED